MSHKDKILAHLKAGRKITQEQCRDMFDCWRLGARIHELRGEGYTIHTEPYITRNGKRVARYELSDV